MAATARSEREPISATILLAVALAVGSMLIVAWSTRPLGPGLYGDGAGYLSAAESLVSGRGLRVIGAPYWSPDSTIAMAQWPPGFVLALSVPLRAGLGTLAAVGLVQMLAAGTIVAVTAVLVGRILGWAWAAIAGVGVLVTPAVLGTELNVVSEPLYIASLALLLVVMTRQRHRPLLTGLVAAILVAVRYLGLAAVGAVAVWAILQPASANRRARNVAAAALPGLATYAVWMARVRALHGAAPHLIIDTHLLAIGRRLGGATMAWLAPWDEGSSWVRIVRIAVKATIVLLAVVAVARLRRHESSTSSSLVDRSALTDDRAVVDLLTASAILAVCHLGVLYVAQALDSSVEFSARTCAPIHYLLTVMLVVTVGGWWREDRVVRQAGLAALILWFAGSAATAGAVVHMTRSIGVDHAALAERESPTLAWLKAQASNMPIYTNEPAKIFFHLNRSARSLPWIATADTLERLDRVLKERPGYVVWFVGGQASEFVPVSRISEALSPERLLARVALTAVARLRDGVVWVPDTSRVRGEAAAR